jgi:hypothetical protein
MLFSALPEANRVDNGMAAMGAGIVAGAALLFGIGALGCVIIGAFLLLAVYPAKNQPASGE